MHGVNIEYFCDENQILVGTELNNIPIISVSELCLQYKNRFIVVGLQKGKKDVHEYLLKMEFSRVGIIHSDEQFYYYLQFPKWKIELEFLENNRSNINKVYSLLADQKSRDIYISRLHTLTSYADFKSYKKHCEFSDCPRNLKESQKIYASNFENQMYFKNDLIYLYPEMTLVDCGAYDGDSLIEFQKNLQEENIYNSFGYCIEPDKSNYEKLVNNLRYLNNVRCYNLGVWDNKTKLDFASSNLMHRTESCIVRQDDPLYKVIAPKDIDSSIEVDSIDNLLYPKKIDIIKMDVEGSETEALVGAAKTIQQNRPQLIISAYHKKDDIWMLPLLVNLISDGYKLYLRQFSFSYSEIVLIGIPQSS
jgi:FkbM family methyltransferase